MDAVLLRSSFDLIADKNQFVETFYEILFETYPQVHPLFANTNIPHQARMLADVLETVVEGVEMGEDLTPILQALGARHITYGVLPEHYPMVGDALITTFQKGLGSQWTPAFQNAWLQAFTVIAQVMTSAVRK